MFFVNRHEASFMLRKIHMCEWNLALCVCACLNWGRVSTLSLWMCLPLLLCVSVGGEKENTAVHVMNTLCDTCLSQGCWVLKRGGGAEKNPLHLPHLKPLSTPHPTPTSLHFTQLPIQQVGLFIATVYSSIFLWVCWLQFYFCFTILHPLKIHVLGFQ